VLSEHVLSYLVILLEAALRADRSTVKSSTPNLTREKLQLNLHKHVTHLSIYIPKHPLGISQGLKYTRRLSYNAIKLNVDSMIVAQVIQYGV
jgi:hypothetical protein